MSTVLNTIVLHFEGGEDSKTLDGNCQVEHDEIRDTVKDSDGNTVEKTSFEPGDVYHFLVKCSSKLRVKKILSTAGSVTALGGVSRERENDLLFVELNSKDNKPSLSYVPSGTVTPEWIGNVGGALVVDKTDLSVDIKSGTIPCYCKTKYQVTFDSYRLNPVVLPYDSYEVFIVIYLEEV